MLGTVLVTGSSGFIGRNLVKSLSDRSVPLLLVVRQSTDLTWFSKLANVSFLTFDEGSALLETSDNSPNIEGVIHLASHYVKDHQKESIPSLIAANLTLGTQVLEFATNSGANWLVNVGSIWQHNADEIRNAANLYAATKNAFEEIVGFYSKSTGISNFNLYLGDTYGPADSRRKLLNIWAEAAGKGITVPMSPGYQKISPLHVTDVVRGLTGIMDSHDAPNFQSAGKQKAFSLRASDPISLRDLADVFREATGLDLRIEWGALPYRHGEVMDPEIPFPTLPDWAPERSLKAGISEVFRPR